MAGKVLDTSVLIAQWRKCGGNSPGDKTSMHAQQWARQLIQMHDTTAIVTPVHIEFLAGVTNRHESELARSYLAEFTIIDEGRITETDWKEALRLAQRIPPSGKRRQLGDCLIRAISLRLRQDVISFDKGFAE